MFLLDRFSPVSPTDIDPGAGALVALRVLRIRSSSFPSSTACVMLSGIDAIRSSSLG